MNTANHPAIIDLENDRLLDEASARSVLGLVLLNAIRDHASEARIESRPTRIHYLVHGNRVGLRFPPRGIDLPLRKGLWSLIRPSPLRPLARLLRRFADLLEGHPDACHRVAVHFRVGDVVVPAVVHLAEVRFGGDLVVRFGDCPPGASEAATTALERFFGKMTPDDYAKELATNFQ